MPISSSYHISCFDNVRIGERIDVMQGAPGGLLQDGGPPQTRVVGERTRINGRSGGDNYFVFHTKPHNEPAKPMCHSDEYCGMGSHYFEFLGKATRA